MHVRRVTLPVVFVVLEEQSFSEGDFEIPTAVCATPEAAQQTIDRLAARDKPFPRSRFVEVWELELGGAR